MHVLVIEDTVTSAVHIRQLLEDMGLQTIHAADGESGVRAFAEHAPDLVLLDIMMPGMDGFDVARTIRQMEQSGEAWTPIIFLTAKSDGEDLARAIESGGDDYLIKPVLPQVLRAKTQAMQRIVQMRKNLLMLKNELNDANEELRRLSSLDGLTGIANRRIFDETLMREWQLAIRRQEEISLLLVDVDHFKQFNDHYGHQAGDSCLQEVARVLAEACRRPTDLAARYGGEEFGLILPGTNAEGAGLVAMVVLDTVRRLGIAHQASTTHDTVTVSIGVCTMRPQKDSDTETGWQQLLQHADDCLYGAKIEGRNRVKCYRQPNMQLT